MHITIERDELVSLVQDLIRIDSVNPYLDADGPGEKEIAEFIKKRLLESGLEVRLVPINETAVNVIGILRGSGKGKSLLLNGHMDTVSAKRMAIGPFEPTHEDGKIYGRGSQDMKGSLGAMIAAVEAINRAKVPLAGDVILTFVADEEYKSIGTEALVKEYRADAAIVCEPSDLDIGVVHKGFAWVSCEVKGKSAHGSRPAEGVDAIVHAGRVLQELDRLSQKLKEKQHAILGSPSVHASLIQGGTELSTYPDYCRLDWERRTIPGETEQEVAQEVEAILQKLHVEDESFQASAELFFWREPYEVSTEEQIFGTLEAACRNRLGRSPGITGFSGWTDAALIQEAGIPTVLFGPTGAGLHGAVEYVETDSLVDMAHILAETICEYCG
ncbi:peptidase M20 [Brevibacillus choshinensis]|uniref:Probable succinyl-diaminopimelate desuccinylase n=1 Tax=Brevibacillus choshinensis TaxID=54911 RepID=A0ABR5N4P6_BRECH|nr:ArgE/DapE family deacylase [Brevibacillus choshinensis]KQL45567.1 peptidase M20 [Brevibacillus choshinensis]